MEISELRRSRCFNSRTLRTDTTVDHGRFPLRAEMNWSRSSLRITAVYYLVSWPSFTVIWIYWHPTVCCVLLLLFPVLQKIIKSASSVIFLVAAFAALRWTHWYLCSSCVPECDVLVITPDDPPGSVPFSPGGGVCVAINCWCRIGEDDDNEKKWEVVRNTYFATSQKEISNSQVARFTQVESFWVWLQILGVSNRSAICNSSVRRGLVVNEDS